MLDIVFGTGLLLVVTGLAIWKGGPGERWGSVVYAIGSLIAQGLVFVMPRSHAFDWLLGIDGLLAFAFLFLAMRFSSLWMAAAMVFQGMELAAHGYHLTGEASPRWHGHSVIIMAVNILSYLILATILAGTISAWRRRGKA